MRTVSRYLVEQGDTVRIACGGNERQGVCTEPKWSRCDSDFECIQVSRVVRNASRGALNDHFKREDLERYALWERLFEEVAPEIVFTVGRGPALMGDVEQVARKAGVPVLATLIHPDQVCPKGPRLDAWGKGCMRALEAETCCTCLVRSRCGVPVLHWAIKAFPAGRMGNWLPEGGFTGRLRTAMLLPRMVDGFLRHWQELREAVSLFIAHSEAARELLIINGVPASRIRLSAPGLEPRGATTKVRSKTGPVKFGFVGRPCAEKGVRTLVMAWQFLPRDVAAELHLWGNPQTGEPDVVASIERLAASDQRVRFHGPFTREQTDSIYDSIDVLVVPSEWFDNCPFVISEAFAAGVPVLGSDFGGIRSMIRHGVDGLLVPMGSAQAWVEALSRLAANPRAVQALSKNVLPPRDARAHVQELREFFDEILGKAAVS